MFNVNKHDYIQLHLHIQVNDTFSLTIPNNAHDIPVHPVCVFNRHTIATTPHNVSANRTITATGF